MHRCPIALGAMPLLLSRRRVPPAASRKLGHHLGHQTFHLLGLVEDRVEQDQLRARPCHLVQTSHAGIGWPVDRERLQVAQLGERVEELQRLAESRRARWASSSTAM